MKMISTKKIHCLSSNQPIWFVTFIGFSLLLFLFRVFDPSASTARTVFWHGSSVNVIDSQKPNFLDDLSSNEVHISTKPPDTVHSPVVKEKQPVYEAPPGSESLSIHGKNTIVAEEEEEPSRSGNRSTATLKPDHHPADSCSGRYIYVHDLPRRFNDDVLQNCTELVPWFDMCPYVVNLGLGPQVERLGGVLSGKSWFETNQFFLEVIFHHRMKNYKCLTNDSSLASAIFVPYYAGFDVGRYLWDDSPKKDYLAKDLVRWIAEKPEWKRMWGRDHFLISGRIAWDFHRQGMNYSDWGSMLMNLPESRNMTMLSIESTSWSNEFGVPYPTYFHASSISEVHRWQKRLRRRRRRYLFSFTGAPRPEMKDSIRGEIINHCLSSRRKCKLLDCHSGRGGKCDNPVEVIKVFQDSVFCLQPSGDSYTRRSTFDSILAGCIPVFFHPFSAYAQYLWHFPGDHESYSVFIPGIWVKAGNVSIIETLSQVPKTTVLALRKKVIDLIPKVIYADPRSKLHNFEDAFDISVKEVLKRVQKVRREREEGKDPGIGFAEENSWMLKLHRQEVGT